MEINYERYLNVCHAALQDEDFFRRFRKARGYRRVVETVSEKIGLEYLNAVERNSPELLKYLPKFADSENVGGPITYAYEKYDVALSPTTCRYIKVLSDLINMFGSLDGLDIVEVGGGYGGQCKIIRDVFAPKSYTIVDLEAPALLAKEYLYSYKIRPTLRQPTDGIKHKYDLFISNYAYSEIDRNYQDMYLENIIKYCTYGYITWNFIGRRDGDGSFTVEEFIKESGKPCVMLPEEPKTGPNSLVIWNTI